MQLQMNEDRQDFWQDVTILSVEDLALRATENARWTFIDIFSHMNEYLRI